MKVTITHIDTACVLININGFKILTDPTLDKKDRFFPQYVSSPLAFSKKYIDPAFSVKEIGDVDLVLLSHDHHSDNLDKKGRAFIKTVPLVLSTKDAEKRLKNPNTIGLEKWQEYNISTDKVKQLKITAIPAQHTNIKRLDKIMGQVIGFTIEWEGQVGGCIYISGDTVFFDDLYELEKKKNVGTAILHLGAGAFPYLKKNLRVTMNGEEAIKLSKLLKADTVIPIHYKGWWHFKESVASLKNEIHKSEINDKFLWLESGLEVELDYE
ncbi:L-ascorbate metabolism protein UlaG (beta-lactamase superfamily) [Flavobacterium cutihirudinis]|uniref:L-ascorbate metabolism protein UlaG (Beta-lactamase superfamily) n=1 Tax=Flavobacterium cutihirudinis TaxID=1265740 RepID=A0A3D9FRQ1_9FLAO|nr:MBL fold metallo-hydrolase [Flavobacterium cutihirudinis]RED23293.1 L-ascorbate metabolism protein UlaG (beta-lactamase superfamily) [Flavobacterium cutihirudinis]